MSSCWHQILAYNLGQFSPDNRFIGLDYGNLFLDSQKAKLVYFHELTHSILSGTTEFGQATEKIYQLLPRFEHFTDNDKKELIFVLRKSQTIIQEGMATLMQLLMLRQEIGPKDTMIWAQKNLPSQYYNWVNSLLFILDMSEKHRNLFTAKIPHLAMNTVVRKRIYELELFKDKKLFIDYFGNEKNNPDSRFLKLIEAIRNDRFLVLKEPEEICLKAGIENFGGSTKQDVVNFMNYLLKLSRIKQSIKIEQINDSEAQNKLILNQANDKIIIGNLNLKLAESATVLPTIKDILHYAEDIEIIFITFLRTEIKLKQEIEQILNKEIELGCVFLCKNGNKFIATLSRQEVINLLNNDLKNKTFVVKWDLYDFGQKSIMSVSDLRTPNVVIYNTIEDLTEKLNKYSNKDKIKYLHFGATEDSPLQGIILKDNLNILHIVNTFGNKKIEVFVKNYNLDKMDIGEMKNEAMHFNNMSSFWLGLDWRLDWYKIMLKNDDIYYR